MCFDPKAYDMFEKLKVKKEILIFLEPLTVSSILQGWRNETVVHMPKVGRGRVILALDSDPLAQRNKVKILGFLRL